jgi:hypothetical protein
MANSFDSNFTRKLAPIILQAFENNRVVTKNVNTQLLEGRYSKADTGEYVDFKRPTDYRSVRTSNGDVSGETKSDIITGKAFGQVQDYFTVFVDYDEADEAIKMHQKNELVDMPMMTRIVTDFEVDYAAFMMKNTALLSGTVGTAVTTWDHVARAGSTLHATGVPKDSPWCFAANPFTQTKLASTVRSLGVNPQAGDANAQATLTENFAGMKVLTSNALASYTTGTGADRAGTLSANPTVTYVGAKDTMTQQLAVTAFQANLVVAAGETITISGRNRLNLSTRQPVVDDTGSNILWSGTVTESVTLNGSGAGTLTVSGPAIYEANGQYNTTDSAAVSGDVVTLGGSASTLIQPNLFWHKNAFAVGSVPIKKLHSTDTVATTKDGLQLRVSKGVGFLENQQKVRIDFRPAYAVLNPFFAGQAFGS